jgi:ATP-binding cassette subfamily F protein 3
LLILDEPTNHLDIDSRAALIEAINDYGGAVILVSHDKYLLDACADRLWLVEDHTVKPFDGDSDDYTKYVLERAGGGNGRQIKTGRGGEARQPMPVRNETPRGTKNEVKLSKRISAIEEKLRKYHDLISRIDATLANPAVFTKDPAKAALLSAQRGELERLLIVAEEEWLSLTGALDEAREAAMRIE